MTRLRDIADHLGLSESTVSRVLNGKGRVGATTRDRVLRYAEKIDYHPNQLAKGLKLQSAGSVGVVVPDISNEFYALLFKQIDSRLAPQGFTPILFNVGVDKAREARFMGHLRSSTVDSMIVATVGSDIYRTMSDSLLERIVFVDNIPACLDECSFVGVDNVKSSFDLTQHLIDRGHERIATVIGSAGESSATDRLEGFERCLIANGVPLRKDWVARTNFQYQDGLEKAKALLRDSDGPTAVIAQNNVLAYATIRAARERFLKVPGDLAVACFDHIDTYGFMRPIITTMLQPIDEIAAVACDLVQSISTNRDYSRYCLESVFRMGETT